MGKRWMGPLLILGTVAGLTPAQSAVVCNGRDRGHFIWGEAPAGCDVAGLGDAGKVKSLYGPFLYDKRRADQTHVQSYMTNMNALIRDVAAGYIKRRQGNPSPAVVNAFVRAVQSVATQESYWTHYRIAVDGRLKIMVGDSGQSLGLMQLHEKTHASRGLQARFDLVSNLRLGIEQFYTEWSRASRSWCVQAYGGSKRLEAQARAAYASYNGGPGAVCRWTDASATWARNDEGYASKFLNQPWGRLVKNSQAALPLDLECVKRGQSSCPRNVVAASSSAAATKPAASATKPFPWTGRLLSLEDGRQCVSVDGKNLYCGADARAFSCLEASAPGWQKVQVLKVKSDAAELKALAMKPDTGREDLCRKAIADLVAPGESLRVEHDLDALDAADGKATARLKSGDTLQVVDYEVSGAGDNLRYRVALADGQQLWIAAGDKAHRNVQKSAVAAGLRVLPVVGDLVETVPGNGIKLRASPSTSGNVLEVLAPKTVVTVRSVVATGGLGERWLDVEIEGRKGFIYSGRTWPQVDADQWVHLRK